MKDLIRQIGPCTLRPRGKPFTVLINAVVSQLISTRAAETIFARILAFGSGSAVEPHQILAAGSENLRACGLSQSKVNTILSLAQVVADGQLNLEALCSADESIISETLLEFKGIGPWTVHMFLIFGLCRLNVLPLGDLGVRMAVRDLYQLQELPNAHFMRSHSERWQPYCSVASWYLWRSRSIASSI